jgi:hypothetical protein
MKKNIIKTLTIFLISGLLSCETDDFFEIQRPQETQWVNTVTFDQGLVAAYWDIFYANGGKAYPQMMDFASSGAAQLLPETSTGAPWNEMYFRLFDQTFTMTKDLWMYSYCAINICNLAITLNDKNENNPFLLKTDGSDYTDNYLRQIGEYHFLRAFAYYNLCRNFAAPYKHSGTNNEAYIPFKTSVPTSKEDIFAEELGTTEEIFSQIIADLQIAKEKLPVEFNSSTMLPNYVTGRATKYTASSLLAKVYFFMGKYSEAKQELDEVIQVAEQEDRYALEEPIEAFNKNIISDIPKESILEFNTGDPTVKGACHYLYWGMLISLNHRDTDNGGRGGNMVKSSWNQFTVSYWALDKMGWMNDPLNGDFSLSDEAQNDLRFQQLYYYLLEYKEDGDPLVYETVSTHSKVNKPQIYLDKYFRGSPGDGRYTKFPIIRLADMYLLRSWIKWNDGDKTGAATDLNKIWNRANPNNLDRYNAGNVNHESIFAEYLKEMNGEGWTLDFMMGTQMEIPSGDADRPAIAPPYSQWKWAVPPDETGLNPDYQ